MSNPGPTGEDERPLAGPDAGMGLPESGTQHATSTDFVVPVGPTAEENPDPLTGDSPLGATPPEQPVPPAYDDPSELVSPPAYDEPTELPVPGVEATDLATGTPAYDALVAESDFTVSEPAPAAGGALAKVKAFADDRPAAFLAAALVAGWLVGKLLGSSGDDDEDEG